MNQLHSLCKINGHQAVEKIKERMWRIQLNVDSLQRVQNVLRRVWDEHQKQENQRDEMLLESLTFYAVVEYTKCFNSKLSEKLDPNCLSDQLPENAQSVDLSEREFHSLIMNYRDMHLVHSDNLLKIADTGAFEISQNEYGSMSVIATRCYREDLAFYGALNALTSKAMEAATKRLESCRQKLNELILTGKATVTHEPIQLMPVSDTYATTDVGRVSSHVLGPA